jgi:hypothetical protein
VLTAADPGLRADIYVGYLENNFNVLSSFIVHFLICAHPSKQTIKSALQTASYKRYNELLGQKDADFDHKCLLCFMAASDLAYVLWQYRNSYKDWCAKVQNQSLKYKCGSQWTSNKKVLGMEDCDEVMKESRHTRSTSSGQGSSRRCLRVMSTGACAVVVTRRQGA